MKTVSAREEGSHSAGEMVLAKEKDRKRKGSRKKRVSWQRSAYNRKQSSAHDKNRSAEVRSYNESNRSACVLNISARYGGKVRTLERENVRKQCEEVRLLHTTISARSACNRKCPLVEREVCTRKACGMEKSTWSW